MPLVLAVVLLTACVQPGSQPGQPSPAATPSTALSNGTTPSNGTAAPSDQAAIFEAVVRRYLSTPGENSFPDPFETAYVLDRTDPSAADPMSGGTPAGPPITAAEQSYLVGALNDLAEVVFVATAEEVLTTVDGCAQAPEGGILIRLGPPDGDDDRVEVGVNGFVACLGATWLTYVVERDEGGWAVTGTTGGMAIS
jgi:hypothetical protein